MIKKIDKGVKRDDYLNSNYSVLIVLLILNIILSLFNPTAQIFKIITVCILLITGTIIGKSYYYLNENVTVSVIFGILGIFSFINLFFLIHLILTFKNGKNGAIRSVNSKNRL